MSKKIKNIVLVITVTFIIIILFVIGSKNKKVYSDINVKRLTAYEIIQGDVAIYEIKENKILDNINDLKVEIVNMRGTSVEEAKIDGKRILIDTSELFTGRYRIKIVLNNEEFLLEDRFRVILIAC